MKERFGDRLLRIRNKFGVSQDAMAPHYGVKLGIYQKYESGKQEPEGTALRKWIVRMEHLEKLSVLPPLYDNTKPPTVENIPTKQEISTTQSKELIQAYEIAHALSTALNDAKAEIERLKKVIEEMRRGKSFTA